MNGGEELEIVSVEKEERWKRRYQDGNELHELKMSTLLPTLS